MGSHREDSDTDCSGTTQPRCHPDTPHKGTKWVKFTHLLLPSQLQLLALASKA